ncbi:Uncharacterized mitochondrial protein AtMg01250, partial [Striga hermonthica]
YDRIEWSCIEQTMLQMGFDPRFVKWIMACVSTVSFSFIINGGCSGLVNAQRGLRQGDPLSPYLFILVSEILSAMITDKVERGAFRGVSVARGAPVLSHLLFADDSLVFCKADKYQAQLLLSILSRYQNFSGQKVNTAKSSIFFSKNTSAATQREVCAVFPGIQIQRSTRYLGMPLGIGKSKKEVFGFVTEAVRKKVVSWKNKFLTAAGRK